jgi:hypothetical protein
MDLATYRAMNRAVRADPDWFEAAMDEMKKVYKPTRDWTRVEIDLPRDGGAGNAVLFSSGWGDGGYGSYWGFDRNGKLIALMTDFQVVDWPGRPNRGEDEAVA